MAFILSSAESVSLPQTPIFKLVITPFLGLSFQLALKDGLVGSKVAITKQNPMKAAPINTCISSCGVIVALLVVGKLTGG